MTQNSTPGNSLNSPENERVEVLPSLSPNNEKNNNPLQIIFLVVLCIVIMGAIGFFIVSQIQIKNPHFMSKINLNISYKLPKFSFNHSNKATVPAKPLAQLSVQEPAVQISAPIPQNPPEQAPKEASEAPTLSPSKTPPSPSTTLNVQGIMASDSHNVVLINNKIYTEGEIVDGVKILAISMDALTIERDGNQEIISVKK